jgi:hypothetical protein
MLESQPAPVASSKPTAIIAEPQKIDLVMATSSGEMGGARASSYTRRQRTHFTHPAVK